MYVFELIKPGTWLTGISDDQRRKDVQALLELLVSGVQDAAVALALYEAAVADEVMEEPDGQSWDDQWARERQIRAALEAKLPTGLSPAERFEAVKDASDQARIAVKRERWAAGELPRSYRRRIPFIHAKSCLYALDTIGKTLKLLGDVPGLSADVQRAASSFADAFPGLQEVRDSSHHAEDRVQGKRRKSRIDLVTVTNEAIRAPDGAVLLVIDMLNGNRLGGTLGDGGFGEVEISAASVVSAQGIVQSVLDCFCWTGPAHHIPS